MDEHEVRVSSSILGSTSSENKEGIRSADEDEREVDVLIEQCNQMMPREAAKGVAAAYARYSTRHQQSIVDQIRAIAQVAVREQLFLDRRLIFTDAAISGNRQRRKGFSALTQSLRKGDFKTLIAFGTNRLFRKSFRASQFVEEVTVELGVRCLFVQCGTDTNKPNWRLSFQIQSAVDEHGTSAYADNIRAAHIGMFERGFVVSTLPPGYYGREVPGTQNRKGKLRCIVAVDLAAASYIVLIFQWYVAGIAIDEIARRLNIDPQAPRPRSADKTWSHTSVKGVLTNERYRGYWCYGKKKSVYLPTKDYVKQVERDEPLCQAYREELRIISEELWHAAQARMLAKPRNSGRKPSGTRPAQPKALNGLLKCVPHDCALRVGGAGGQMMYCPACNRLPAETRPLYSHLNRLLAHELVVARLLDAIRQDEELIKMAIDECIAAARQAELPDPGRLDALKRQAARLGEKIRANMRNRGDSEQDQAECDGVIRELRVERSKLDQEIARAESAALREVRIPTEAEIRELLRDLEAALQADAVSDDLDAKARLHELLKQLTGGRIELSQMGERRAQRGWLQGRFTCDLLGFIVDSLGGAATSPGTGTEIVLDFQQPSSRDEDADSA